MAHETLQGGTPVIWDLPCFTLTRSSHTSSLTGPQGGRHIIVWGFFTGQLLSLEGPQLRYSHSLLPHFFTSLLECHLLIEVYRDYPVPSSAICMILLCIFHIRYIHLMVDILGWPKSPFSFFCKIKDTFFIFTNNFIDVDI